MSKKAHCQMTLLSVLFLILIAGLTILLLPLFQKLSAPAGQAALQNWISKQGIAGIVLIFAIQAIQIIIAFIPGEPVEILAGLMYGAAGGLLICLSGSIFASALIFTLSGRYGRKLLFRLFGQNNLANWAWLQNSKKRELVTFILFLVPGTPKDMLTYLIGLTGMKTGRFLGLSTLARIPSILSSTMIGSALGNGEWEFSLIIFLITGITGITGICYKDRVLDFCRRNTRNKHRRHSRCECLDFVAAANSKDVYPVIYCHLKTEGHFDMEHLIQAVKVSAHYVPELLYSFDFQHFRFTDCGFTARQAVRLQKTDEVFHPQWDLSQNTQLQITIHPETGQDTITVGISHLLTDGAGFLQYLYLLAALYNGKNPGNLINCRDITPLLKTTHVRPDTEQTRQHRNIVTAPLRDHKSAPEQTKDTAVTHWFCLTGTIAPDDFQNLHSKAKRCQATLNDVFLAAYARVIARLQKTDTVIIPCPADLRRFRETDDQLTIANMTGIYKRITIEIGPQQTFDQTLTQVHLEMALQKSRYRCFYGLRLLAAAFHRVPHKLLKRILRTVYLPPPVSYTNLGRIDAGQLHFNHCQIISCHISGACRPAPDFQLTISTFRNTCSLNCTLSGNPADETYGRLILNKVIQELLDWVHRPLRDDR